MLLLPLRGMAERHCGLTLAIAEAYVEAARVCLDRHYRPPVEFTIRNGNSAMETVAEWEPTDDRIRSAWLNEISATESGAYACVIAAVELSEGLYAIRRAETRTGADYYLAPSAIEQGDLEGCVRLEVSGSNLGSWAVLARRLREKVEQTLRGNSNLPAMAGVVGFRARVILLSQVLKP